MADQGKKWDEDGIPLEDTNCANIGSDEDKAARKNAALTEPAWEGVGQEAGLWVWRIEKFQVVAWPADRRGEFHSGDSYIILTVTGGDSALPKNSEQIQALRNFLKAGEEKVFARIDKDGNGAISKSEWEAAFKTIDVNGDGHITRKEWYTTQHETDVFDMLPKRNRGAAISKQEWDTIFCKWDTNEDGSVHIQQMEDGIGEEPLQRDIYFWLGKNTSIDERGVAAYKTVELDDFFSGACNQNREVQGHESEAFQNLFQDIQYLDGGVDSGFDPVHPDLFETKLHQVKRTKKGGHVVQQVPFDRASLNLRDCFILDQGPTMYLWYGDEASPFLKNDTNLRAQRMENERHGQCKAEVDFEAFMKALGGKGEITPADQADNEAEPDFGEGVLYRIMIDEDRQINCTEVGRGELHRSMLCPDDVMMLDTRTEIFLWYGQGASDLEKRMSMKTATNYLKVNGRDPWGTAIHIVKGRCMNNKTWARTFPYK